jgi:hypothetical protein
MTASLVRSGAIARRTSATKGRAVVNDDGGAPGAVPGAPWDVFRVLAVIDGAMLPLVDRWPLATLIVSTADALAALAIWASVIGLRLAWRATVAAVRVALFALRVAALPLVALFGRPAQSKPKRRTWRRMLRL